MSFVERYRGFVINEGYLGVITWSYPDPQRRGSYIGNRARTLAEAREQIDAYLELQPTTTTPTVCECDINKDGIVNVSDFAIMAQLGYSQVFREACLVHNGKTCVEHEPPQEPIPPTEPTPTEPTPTPTQPTQFNIATILPIIIIVAIIIYLGFREG